MKENGGSILECETYFQKLFFRDTNANRHFQTWGNFYSTLLYMPGFSFFKKKKNQYDRF